MYVRYIDNNELFLLLMIFFSKKHNYSFNMPHSDRCYTVTIIRARSVLEYVQVHNNIMLSLVSLQKWLLIFRLVTNHL